MSYRIGICEDEDIFRTELADMLKKIAKKNGLPIKIYTFSNLERLENFMKDSVEEPLDLLLLDIYLNGKENGIEFAKRLRQEANPIEIIFVTNTQEFALEGYTIDSKAYILKPVDEKKLEEAVLRTLKKYKGKRIILQTHSKVLTLDLSRVLYIEIMNKELIIHYTDSTTDKFRMSLKSIKNLLPSNQFFQIHRSYIVSIPAIQAIKNHEVILLNNERIPVSKQYYTTLQERLMQWYMEN